ncbi:MAG: type II toxin-antitoxin system RelE/ParE family toxin [Oscillospiraceae bacterium]|nr:type II toxin-antitoxin system RelE/ParE family toxin [Oscillospiraceae bacterium]
MLVRQGDCITREFIRLHEFERQCKKLGLNEDDIISIENIILDNPIIGDVIIGTGGIRKFRFAFKNRGKSSGARVVYIDFASFSKTYLLTVFAKNETDNLSKAERNELFELVLLLKNELRKKGV